MDYVKFFPGKETGTTNNLLKTLKK